MNAKNKEEHEAIKKLLANGRRDRAMYLLKLKKIRETHVNNAQQAYMKLEELVCYTLTSSMLFAARSSNSRIAAVGMELTKFVDPFVGHEYRNCPNQQ